MDDNLDKIIDEILSASKNDSDAEKVDDAVLDSILNEYSSPEGDKEAAKTDEKGEAKSKKLYDLDEYLRQGKKENEKKFKQIKESFTINKDEAAKKEGDTNAFGDIEEPALSEAPIESEKPSIEENEKTCAEEIAKPDEKQADPKEDIFLNVKSIAEQWGNTGKIEDIKEAIKQKQKTESNGADKENKECKYYNSNKLDTFFTSIYDITDVEQTKKKLKEKVEAQAKKDEAENARTSDFKIEAPQFSGILGKILNETEDNEAPIDDEEAIEREIEDYLKPEDAEAIKTDLLGLKRQAFFKIIFTSVITFLLLVIDLTVQFKLFDGVFVNYKSSPFFFGLSQVLLLTLVILAGFKTFTVGIAKLFAFKPTNDTLASLAVLAALVQAVFVLAGIIPEGRFYIYSGLSSAAFSFVLFGKFLYISTVYKNFLIVSSDEQKTALVPIPAAVFPDRELNDEDCCGAIKTDFAGKFLDLTFDKNPTQKTGRIIALLVFPVIVAILVYSYIKGLPGSFLPAFAVSSLVLAASFLSELGFSFPYFLENLYTRKFSSALLGYQSSEMFAKRVALAIKDTDLFLSDELSIAGIKMLNSAELYDTIIKIASLYYAVDGPLAGAFIKIIDNKVGQLKKVSNVESEEGRGVSAVIDSKRVYAGSSDYLRSKGVVIPAGDFEAVYQRSGKNIIIFAEEETVLGMFLVNYGIKPSILTTLSNLYADGMELYVYTDDYNITTKMIKEKTKLDELAVTVCGKSSAPKMKGALEKREKIAANAVSCSGLVGIEALLYSAARMKRSVKIMMILNIISIALGVLIAGIMMLTGSLAAPFIILIYQLIWLLIGAIVSVFRL